MRDIVISGTGVFTPTESISNAELVESFNQYVDAYNQNHPDSPLEYSSAQFIEKASGIKSRYVVDKQGILDIKIMHPQNLERSPEDVSLHAQIAIAAAKQAMENANLNSSDLGGVIVACSNVPRPYPALSIEIQEQLSISGFAFDLNVACASAAFGIHTAYHCLRSSRSKAILVVSPEICTGQLNFRDRDSHFIFGDACSAIILQATDDAKTNNVFQILDTKLLTKFSNNIRNSFGYLNYTQENILQKNDLLFKQQGRKVFKEVTPIVSEHITSHLQELGLNPQQITRYWLHQANLNMNELIAKKLLGEVPNSTTAPIILDRYANTSSAGSIIAFHLYHEDLKSGDYGLIAAFGAGYSCGSVVIRKC